MAQQQPHHPQQAAAPAPLDPGVNALLQMMHQNQQQQAAQHAEQIAAMQAQQNVLMQRVAAAAAPHVHRPRIPMPSKYNGTTPPLDDWAATIRQQLEFYALAGQNAVLFIVSHFEGAALDWWQHSALAANRQLTPADLEAGLRARFQPVSRADTAYARLHGLAQGKHPVHEYVDAFRRIMVALPAMDAATAMNAFQRGLKADLRMQLVQQQPATLDAMIILAVRIGAATETAASDGSDAMQIHAMETLNYGSAAAAAPADVSTQLAAMQLQLAAMYSHRGASTNGGRSGGGSGKPPPKISGMLEKDVVRYMAEGRCFGCSELGHGSRHCPWRQIGADGKPFWQKK